MNNITPISNPASNLYLRAGYQQSDLANDIFVGQIVDQLLNEFVNQTLTQEQSANYIENLSGKPKWAISEVMRRIKQGIIKNNGYIIQNAQFCEEVGKLVAARLSERQSKDDKSFKQTYFPSAGNSPMDRHYELMTGLTLDQYAGASPEVKAECDKKKDAFLLNKYTQINWDNFESHYRNAPLAQQAGYRKVIAQFKLKTPNDIGTAGSK